jgi:hypothetical protein
VISHDIPRPSSGPLSEFFLAYQKSKKMSILALNIKADGLSALLGHHINTFNIANYFVFDMAVPDALTYIHQGQPVFTRHSEYETVPSFYAEAAGVWLDEFNRDWIDSRVLAEHVANNKKICIVSSELHQRPHWPRWQKFKEFFSSMNETEMVSLCTDFPVDARKFFNE